MKPETVEVVLNQTFLFFLFPSYRQFRHSTEVRKALAKDKEWQEQFLIPNLALIDKQESESLYLLCAN